MEQRLGTCSICGGDVYGHVGAWWGTVPPPPASCRSCGAVEARSVIQMTPRRIAPSNVGPLGGTGGTNA